MGGGKNLTFSGNGDDESVVDEDDGTNNGDDGVEGSGRRAGEVWMIAEG